MLPEATNRQSVQINATDDASLVAHIANPEIVIELSNQATPLVYRGIVPIINKSEREVHIQSVTHTGTMQLDESEEDIWPPTRKVYVTRCLAIPLSLLEADGVPVLEKTEWFQGTTDGMRQNYQNFQVLYSINETELYLSPDAKRPSHDYANLIKETFNTIDLDKENFFVPVFLQLNNGISQLVRQQDSIELKSTVHHIIPKDAVRLIKERASHYNISFEEYVERFLSNSMYKGLLRIVSENWDHPLNLIPMGENSHNDIHSKPLPSGNNSAAKISYIEKRGEAYWNNNNDKLMVAMSTIALVIRKLSEGQRLNNFWLSTIDRNSQVWSDIVNLYREIMEEDPEIFAGALLQLVNAGVVSTKDLPRLNSFGDNPV